jgi:uncharacterized protein with GYD domain
MPKYLIEASYTADGLKGVMAKGGTARVDAVSKMMADLGGSVESFHFAFGATDAYVIVEAPDDVTAAAVALTVGASGLASAKTTKLLTAAELDRATQIQANYQAPGS